MWHRMHFLDLQQLDCWLNGWGIHVHSWWSTMYIQTWKCSDNNWTRPSFILASVCIHTPEPTEPMGSTVRFFIPSDTGKDRLHICSPFSVYKVIVQSLLGSPFNRGAWPGGSRLCSSCLCSCVTIVLQKRAHGQCTLPWAQTGDGTTFQLSILCITNLKHLKRCKYCVTFWAKHLVLV